jgi:hypothetical protein
VTRYFDPTARAVASVAPPRLGASSAPSPVRDGAPYFNPAARVRRPRYPTPDEVRAWWPENALDRQTLDLHAKVAGCSVEELKLRRCLWVPRCVACGEPGGYHLARCRVSRQEAERFAAWCDRAWRVPRRLRPVAAVQGPPEPEPEPGDPDDELPF